MPSLIDTCNEETFRELRPLRPGLTRAPPRPLLGRPGNWAGLGPRRRGGRATAHLPGALGPHAARLSRRLPQAAAAPGGRRATRGPPNRAPGQAAAAATYFHLTPPPGLRSSRTSFGRRPPPPPLRIALTDPDRRGGGERGGGGGRPAGGAGKQRGRAAVGTGRGAGEWGRGPAVPGAGGGEEGGEGRCAGRRGAEAPAAGKGGKDGGRGEGGRGRVGREAAESLHRPDAAATADAAAILIERSDCARLFPSGRRSRRVVPRALIPPPPALPPLPPHTRRTPHTPPGPARRPPFPLPSGLPALGPPPPRARPPRPARISVSGRKGNAKPAPLRGESGESEKMAEQRAGRGCAASPTAATARARRPSERRVARASLSPARRFAIFPPGLRGGLDADLSRPPPGL